MSLATQNIKFGAFTPVLTGGDALEAINLWEMRLNRRMDVVNNFRKWGGDSGNFKLSNTQKSLGHAAAHGRIPLISWEPLTWNDQAEQFTLDRIVAGDHDVYIRESAQVLRGLGFTIYIRPMHEMNGNWYHWSGDPDLYVRAWRHIVDIFDEEGVDNVKWVWCVNCSDSKDENGKIYALEKYWPGPSYVDVLGIDGYNCYGGWRTFSSINMSAYKRVCALDPNLPVWIVETATSESTPELLTARYSTSTLPSKAAWIQDMWATTGMERVQALLWFDQRNPKSYDWRIDSSSAAISELRRQVRLANGYVAPPPPYVPPVPDRVAVVPDGPGAVRLSWRIAPSFTRGYKVLRKTTALSVLQVVPKTQTSVRITDLEPGMIYTFGVQTYTLVRNSAASSLVSCVVE